MSGGCTGEMSHSLEGEVRQWDRAAGGPQILLEVAHILPSKWHSGGSVRGLNISGKVERVPLQFGKGDGRMLQVIEQHLDLR